MSEQETAPETALEMTQETAPEAATTTLPQQPVAPAPSEAETETEAQAPAPGKDRRVLRAVLRWTAAVAVCAVVGTGTAYGITRMDRTDVPGLATASDGRWDYPELTRPPLPSGSPGPFADANPAGAHYADLRALLLPAPEGVKEDKALRGSDGWLATRDYLAEYAVKEERDELRQKLVDAGLRHIAARGWTTPDGIRTRVYLLQFDTANVVDNQFASDNVAYGTPAYQVRGSGEAVYDEGFPERAAVSGVERTAYVESKPYGAEQVRQAYVAAGDVFAVILQSRKGTAPAVPFQQTVVLQSQLLG
ncbi:hypothetical protein [Streptomyces sp. NPDC101165]|uniref:hypothetical protein n=1 Tax=Streptomyces sp. NPDC101165 TaxID=3366119 RepID=UPI00380A1303